MNEPLPLIDNQNLLDHLPDSFWAVDRDYRLLAANKRFRDEFQIAYGVELRPGMILPDLIPPQIAPLWRERYDRALNGESFTIEEHFEWGGMSLIFEVVFSPLDPAGAKPSGAIVFSRNINDRKQTESALREQSFFLRQIIDTSPNFVFVRDRQGRFILVNKAMADAYGTTVETLTNQIDDDVNPDPDKIDYFRQEDLEVMDSLQEKFIPEEMIITASGAQEWLQTYKRPVIGPDGQANQVLAIATLITGRKQIEETLKRNEQQLRRYNEALFALATTPAITSGDLNLALQTITEQTTQALAIERASIWQYRPEPKTLICLDLYEQSPNRHSEGLILSANDYPAYFMAVETERIIIADDAHTHPQTKEFSQPYLFPLGIASMLDTSVRVGGQIVGVVCLEQVGPIHHWSLEEQNFATALADLVALAIEANNRKRLEQQIQESLILRNRQAEVANFLASRMVETANFNQFLQEIVEIIRDKFGYYFVQLFRRESNKNVLSMVAGSGRVGQQLLAQTPQLNLGRGIVGQAALGHSVLRPDVRSDPQWQPNPLLLHTHGQLAVPIKSGTFVIGVLDVQANLPNQLNEEVQLVMEGLSSQLAIAIESMRLRQEMAEQLSELSQLQRLMSQEGWQNFLSSRPQTANGYIFEQNEIRPIEPTKAKITNGQSTNPLAIRGEIIGLLGVEEDANAPLSEAEHTLLQAISSQVAEALENARLLEQTQKRAVELETVARVSAATSTILDSGKLLQAVVDLTQRNFGLYHAHIYLFDEKSQYLVLAAGTGEAGRIMIEQEWRIQLEQRRSLIARAGRRRQGQLVRDVRREADFLPNPFLPATRSELAVPMLVGNNLIGVLDVQSDRVGFFTDDDVRIQTALATQIAIAVQNAILYEEQLKTAEKLREVDRLKTEFLASMSHELRTPLNSIIGFADVLLEGLDGDLTPRMNEDVRLIRDSGDHLRNLIGEILDMSKIEAGMMELRYEEIEMLGLVDEIMANARKLLTTYRRNIMLSSHVSPEVTTIWADRTRLRQILYNIISNAIKFTEAGSVMLNVKMQGYNLVVNVRDTGIGIKAEHIPIVFEQFRQVDGSLTRTAGGTGLGLPISKRLIELHGGEIWVDSEPGRGSTFWFTIPKEKPATKPGTGPLRRQSST